MFDTDTATPGPFNNVKGRLVRRGRGRGVLLWVLAVSVVVNGLVGFAPLEGLGVPEGLVPGVEAAAADVRCPAGYSPSGSGCRKKVYTAPVVTTVRVCDGVRSGSACTRTVRVDATKVTTTKTVCVDMATRAGCVRQGYWRSFRGHRYCSTAASSGTGCWVPGRTRTVTETRYVCSAGYRRIGAGCYKTVDAWSTRTTVRCPSGYTRSGHGQIISCHRYVTAAPTTHTHPAPTTTTAAPTTTTTTTVRPDDTTTTTTTVRPVDTTTTTTTRPVGPRVDVRGFGGAARSGAGVVLEAFTVPSGDVSCSASRVSGIAVTLSWYYATGRSRILSVDTGTEAGSVTVRVVCSRAGYRSYSGVAVFTAVAVSGLDGASRDGAGVISEVFTVAPAAASCAARWLSGISAGVSVSGGSGSWRVLKVTTTGTGTARVRVTCSSGGAGHSASASYTARRYVGVRGLSGASGAGAVSDAFTVEPDSASCAAQRTSGPAAAVSVAGTSRVGRSVTVQAAAAGTVVVRVVCSADGWADTARIVAFTVTARCAAGEHAHNPAHGTGVHPPGVHNTQTHRDAHGGGTTPTGCSSDHPPPDTTTTTTTTAPPSTTTTAPPPPDTTTTTTTTAPPDTTTTTTTTAPPRRVRIVGFSGSRDVTATQHTRPFVVLPSTAVCALEASGAAATVSFGNNSGARRWVNMHAAGTVTVKLTCRLDGYADAEATYTAAFKAAAPACELSITANGNPVSGTWTTACTSSRRGNAQTPYYAKRYTFTLDTAAVVTVAAGSGDHTPVLYVLSAAGDLQDHKQGAPDRFELAAGGYSVEVTTTAARATGAFTIAVSAAAAAEPEPEPEPATVRGLLASYDATVGTPFSVGFNYEPDDARVSVSVSPSGFSLTESDRSGLFAGSAGLAGTPRYADTYTVTITLTQTGRADDHTFTVVAACPQGHTQQSDRSCQAPICPAVSWGSLGLDNRTVATTASWSATDCTSKNRPPGRHARYYNFTLGAAADVAIDVSSQHDTYLYLMSGHDTRSGFLHRNNDIAGSDRNSRILKRLPAGRYTVEATTYSANKTGRFKVQARVVAAPALTDFKATHNVTVGVPFSTGFTYRPAAALLTTTVHPDTLTITDTAGTVTITATPLAGTYTITLRFAQPGRTDTRTITINATCPTGEVELSDGTCAAPLDKLMQRHLVSLSRPPPGYLSNSCYRTGLSDGSGVFTCRRIQEERVYMSKTSSRILAASEPLATFGTLLALESGEVLEGCQSITSDHWQCDFRSDHVWTKRVGTTQASYYYPAFIRGVVEPARCAAAVGVFWSSAASVTPNPATFTAVVTQCEGLIVGEDE